MNILPVGGEGYETPSGISFDEDNCYLVVQLEPSIYGYEAREVTFNGKTFNPKEELHITILSNEAAEILKEHLQEKPEDIELVQGYVNHAGWVYKKEDCFYHVVQEPGVETIIQMVCVQGAESFYESLSGIVGHELPFPPTHVTLYMIGTEKGIGLPTQEVFDELVREEVRAAEITAAEHKDS